MIRNCFILLILFLVIILLLPQPGISQKYDNVWISGIGNNRELDPADWGYCNMLDFRSGQLLVDTFEANIEMSFSPITICDKDGGLLFATNGNSILDIDTRLPMYEGAHLNRGAEFSNKGNDYQHHFGYFDNAYIVLPDGRQDSVFYIIHSYVKYHKGETRKYLLKSTHLQITKLDFTKHITRRIPYRSKLLYDRETEPMIHAVKHANGLDWWIFTANFDHSKYYTLLLQGDSITQEVINEVPTFPNEIDSVLEPRALAYLTLYPSNSGETIIDDYGYNIRRIFDFDRCSGEMNMIDTLYFSKLDTFRNEDSTASVTGAPTFFVFSPTDRYLYCQGVFGTYQYDLQDDNWKNSRILVGDPPIQLNRDLTPMWFPWADHMYLGPDGRIYNFRQYSNRAILYPERKGLDCGYCPEPCIYLDKNLDNPELWPMHQPNYRLGPLEGSPCDTIVSSNEENTDSYDIKLYPNPSTDGKVTIDIQTKDWRNLDTKVSVYDISGRKVYTHKMPPYAYLHRLADPLSPGVYFVKLEKNGDILATEKLIVMGGE